MNWPKAAGNTQLTRALFVLVVACIVGVLIYLVVTLVAGASAGRDERACAFAREQIRDNVVRMGNYRGTHPCAATTLDDDDLVWELDGVYRSGLTSDVQPSIPFTGMVVWDEETEAFHACVIDFRRAGEDSTEVETNPPEPQPAHCLE